MVIQCEAPIWGISWSPNGQFIAAAGSKSVEIRDALIGSSVISLDSPRSLFYVSSLTDGLRVEHRLKTLIQKPAVPIIRWSELRLLETIEHALAEDTASLAPVMGLKNVLASLLALIHAVCEYVANGPTEKFLLGIKSLLTEVMSTQRKEKEGSGVPHQLPNDLEDFVR